MSVCRPVSNFEEQFIKSGFTYNPHTGIICRTNPIRIGRYGREVNGKGQSGYLRLRVQRRFFLVHRVGWFLHYGRWPATPLDHIDGNILNNRIVNLREVNHVQSAMNRKVMKNSKSGIKGVCYSRAHDRFIAKVSVNKEVVFIGYFKTKEEAVLAYEQNAKRFFGEYYREEVA